MKIRKSNFWIVLSNIIGYVGVGLCLLAGSAVALLKRAGYTIKLRTSLTNPDSLKTIEWRHFLYLGAVTVAVILMAVIFRLIGKAVYKKRVKRALEESRKAQSGGLLAGYDIDPETQEKVVDAAKKAVPIVAGVVLACVVVKAVKKARAKKTSAEIGSGAKNYYYF